jgi:hypothetical protein
VKYEDAYGISKQKVKKKTLGTRQMKSILKIHFKINPKI